MLTNVWEDKLDFCRVTNGAHIEHLQDRTDRSHSCSFILEGRPLTNTTMAIIQRLLLASVVASLCLLVVNAAVTTKPVVVDSAFVGAGNQAGVRIWRIERFNPVAVAAEKYGHFHVGDAYLVLNTKNNKRSWDIHTWHGNETSNDESATAAFKMVELDNYLGGGPVQHREDIGEESDLFLSYFPNGLTYLPGGVPSGLRHVEAPR
ncbi:actin depolymerising venom protein gelsolin 1-like isoform X2 [Periplaneta americana]|uniref:actin depolymerising venom protein gelsolin 1-like isoform X2 n=1 Tax=Periplaneta americana TaxID=6978 RepID=UPI0037E733BB